MRATHARVPYRIHSGAGGTGPSKSLARWFRPGVVIATELRQRRPKPSTFRTLTPRFGGSEDQPLYGVARWLGRRWVDFTVLNVKFLQVRMISPVRAERCSMMTIPSLIYETVVSSASGPSKSLARCFRPGVVIATELRQRRRHRVESVVASV